MPEKSLFFQRPEPPVVGAADEMRKQAVANEIRKNFSDNRDQLSEDRKRKLRAVEYPKSELEQSVIDDVNQLTNKLLVEAGVQPYDIPTENIYLVPHKTYKEINGDDDFGDAFTSHGRQSIVIDAEHSIAPLERAGILVHEMTHLKNFISIEALNEKRDSLRRIGIQINSTYKRDESTGSFTAFSGLNEAIVARIEKELFKKLLQNHPELQQEHDQIFSSEVGKKECAEMAKKFDLDEEDIRWMDEKTVRAVSYPEQRKVLEYILATIVKKLPEEFPDKDAAFKLFTQAHFGGQMLPLARVIRSIFGEDSFRFLSMMSAQDKNSARLTMNYFQKKGGRMISQT